MAPDIIERLKRRHSVSFVYRSYHLPMPDPSPINADSLNSNFYSSDGVVAGHSGQFTPMRLPVNTVIHTTLAGFEPTTCLLLVRCATSSAINLLYFYHVSRLSIDTSIRRMWRSISSTSSCSCLSTHWSSIHGHTHSNLTANMMCDCRHYHWLQRISASC